MLDGGLNNAEEISKKIKNAFVEHAGWKESEKELRELRKKVTFAIFSEEDDLNKVTAIVDELFSLLRQTGFDDGSLEERRRFQKQCETLG
jgi:type I restriction enzyme R subunit